MTRTKLRDRILPSYTEGEEIFNMVSHIVGGAFGIVALVLCVIVAAIHKDPWAVVSSSIYGGALVLLYTMSSVYHGLRSEMAKKVFQVLDHCTIYFLIGGTYTPILLCALRPKYPGWAWTIFGIVWGFAAMATVFTAIDLKKYSKLSMLCYVGMGWSILLAVKQTIEVMQLPALILLFAGGVAYTIGAVLYGIGKKHKYVHSIFHVFVLAGSVLQFLCIILYVI